MGATTAGRAWQVGLQQSTSWGHPAPPQSGAQSSAGWLHKGRKERAELRHGRQTRALAHSAMPSGILSQMIGLPHPPKSMMGFGTVRVRGRSRVPYLQAAEGGSRLVGTLAVGACGDSGNNYQGTATGRRHICESSRSNLEHNELGSKDPVATQGSGRHRKPTRPQAPAPWALACSRRTSCKCTATAARASAWPCRCCCWSGAGRSGAACWMKQR